MFIHVMIKATTGAVNMHEKNKDFLPNTQMHFVDPLRRTMDFQSEVFISLLGGGGGGSKSSERMSHE